MLSRISHWKVKSRDFQKNTFLPKFWISGGWVEIWTIRHRSWWSFEEERVEGEQKQKILNDEITMLSIAGISKWHKESLEAEKMWKQLCEVTLSYQMDQRSLKWNPRKYQSVLGRKFTTLKHNIAIAVKMLMNVSNGKNAIFSYFWGIEIGGWVKFHTSCMAARLTSTDCVTLSKWAKASHSYCMPLNSSDTWHWHHPYYVIYYEICFVDNNWMIITTES